MRLNATTFIVICVRYEPSFRVVKSVRTPASCRVSLLCQLFGVQVHQVSAPAFYHLIFNIGHNLTGVGSLCATDGCHHTHLWSSQNDRLSMHLFPLQCSVTLCMCGYWSECNAMHLMCPCVAPCCVPSWSAPKSVFMCTSSQSISLLLLHVRRL